MANIASSKKRARQGVARNRRQSMQRSMLRTYIAKVTDAIEKADKSMAEKAYKEVLPIIDRMVNKGIIHKNKAARHKSFFTRKINNLS